MYATLARELPDGNAWAYEAKLDGYRCLAGKQKNGVMLWSRRGNLFTRRFPEIARACEKLPFETLVDGEVIAIDGNGRVSFNALQHARPTRISSSTPLTFLFTVVGNYFRSRWKPAESCSPKFWTRYRIR